MTKVRRLSDGKIFSNPRGVAMEIGKPVTKVVYYCCRGYILSVEGERYEWVYDSSDRGKVESGESYWNRRGKWTTNYSNWSTHNSVRDLIFRRSTVIKYWLRITDNPEEWRNARILTNELEAVYTLVKNPYKFPWIFDPQTVSRHLHAYRLFYRKMFGMHENYLSTSMYKGRIFKFVSADADPEFDVLIDEVIDSLERGNTKPVIRVNDGQWFESMRKAERFTGVPYYRIFHCCEGDIPHYEDPITQERIEFRYATEKIAEAS